MLYSKHLSSLFYLLLLLLSITNLAQSIETTPYQPKDYYLIQFGLPKSSDNHKSTWSDEDFLKTPPSTTTAVTSVEEAGTRYDTARIFRGQTAYSVPVSSWGPKLIRLYLHPPTSTSYNNLDTTESFLSLTINGLEILRNFSGYLVLANANANPNTMAPAFNGLVREVYVTVNEEDGKNSKAINLTFSPSNPEGFGFINAIEVISVPDKLYIDRSSPSSNDNFIPHLAGNLQDYMNNPYNFQSKLTMENIIRLNAGGVTVEPIGDTGIRRTWYSDEDFVAHFKGKYSYVPWKTNEDNIHYTMRTPAYIAPVKVYSTARIVGPYASQFMPNKNLTWAFEVDNGFDYLVRLHFCEIRKGVNKNQVVFSVDINNQTALDFFDVFDLAGGRYIPIYRDVVTSVDDYFAANTSSQSRVLLWITLRARNYVYVDAILNGLEIFKLSSKNGSLVAPNPALRAKDITPNNATPRRNTSHRWIPIIGGIIGVILVSLALFVCFMISYRRNKAKKKLLNAKSVEDSSKLKWLSPLDDSGSTATTASVVSWLPSDLCQLFSLAQIKVATSDFDEKLIIGKGGFGMVYKGSLKDGVKGTTTQVAIKRLNTTSKQGAREFQTEIEMLSRLRHVHLVSLIGYCEDHGEMILVYEYMPRGSLRDHLMYKNAERDDDNDNKTLLSWKQRLLICVGAARGLHYLHAGARQLIIHRDVKSTNILLDEKWTAKVSDFGLSKASPIPSELGPTHISTAVKGSAGYLDPEYYQCHRLTEKSDVYSFGVVLFEVLCARAAVNPKLPKEQANLAMWARNHYKRGTLHTIVDPNLAGQIAPESLRKFGEIAEMCVRDRGSERPSMGDIVWGLEFALQLQQTAEKNNINSGSLVEDLSSSNTNLDGGSSGNTDNDMFSRSSLGAATKSLDSPTITSNSSDCLIDTKSDAVFSEIIDPTPR